MTDPRPRVSREEGIYVSSNGMKATDGSNSGRSSPANPSGTTMSAPPPQLSVRNSSVVSTDGMNEYFQQAMTISTREEQQQQQQPPSSNPSSASSSTRSKKGTFGKPDEVCRECSLAFSDGEEQQRQQKPTSTLTKRRKSIQKRLKKLSLTRKSSPKSGKRSWGGVFRLNCSSNGSKSPTIEDEDDSWEVTETQEPLPGQDSVVVQQNGRRNSMCVCTSYRRTDEDEFEGGSAPVIDLSRFNPEEFPIEDFDERARLERAREMDEGIDFVSSTVNQDDVIVDDRVIPSRLTTPSGVPLPFYRSTTLSSSNTSLVAATGYSTETRFESFFSTLDGDCTLRRTVHTQVDFVHCLVPDLLAIANFTFYWGKMDRYEAEKLLENKPEGTFLLRDSAQEDYFFSVSFRRYGRSLHARIEQWNHLFSFDSHDPSVYSAPNITGLMDHYKDPSSCMFFEPLLTNPLHRNFVFPLQHLCRAVICSSTTYDGVNKLMLPKTLQSYLREYHYKQKVVLFYCFFIVEVEKRLIMTSFLRRENKAYRHVRAVNLGRFSLTGSDSGANYLRDIIDHPVSPEVKVQDRVEAKQATIALPITSKTLSISEEVTDLCRFKSCTEADGLSAILKSSHLQSLFSCHDAIAEKKFEPVEVKEKEEEEKKEDFLDGISRASTSDSGVKSGEEEEEDGEMEDGVTIRMVGLRKSPYEPLGVTVRSENGVLVVARILGGGVVDRSGLLNVGDVVREVNGVEVFTPEQLAEVIKSTSDAINLKVEANFLDNGGGPQVMGGYDSMMHAVCYMRALFNYNPEEDTLLPCSEIGLAFHQGDVLEIVDQSDPNWWQARIVGIGGVGGPKGPAGLIPSQDLEERRKAFVKPEFDYVHKTGLCGTKISKKKKRHMYQTKAYSDFEKAELLMYEEVVRSPPFQRKTLVLIGAAGVGRRTLKNKLMTYDPSKFGAVIPFTSRPLRPGEEDGKSYHFSPRPEVESDITNHKYLEYGEFDGHIYGTKLDSIRSVIRSGRMCILDCSPAAVKLLHNSAEFRPYVVFIAAPGVDQLRFMHEYGRVMAGQSQRTLTMDRALRYSSRRARTMESLASFIEDEDLRRTMEESARLQRAYDKYIDVVVVNEDFDLTFQKVLDALDTLSTESQWVPVQWIY